MRDASRFSRRDGDEAFGELKRIAQAGVTVWFYQDGTRVRVRELRRQHRRVSCAREMNAEFRRADRQVDARGDGPQGKAGHVTGGRVFGYDNVEGGRPRRAADQRAAGRGGAAHLRALRGWHGLHAHREAAERRAGAPAPRPQQAAPGRLGAVDGLRSPAPAAVSRRSRLEQDAEARRRRARRPPRRGPKRSGCASTGPSCASSPTRRGRRRTDASTRARAQYERMTHGQRRPHRDRDSKYLLTGFGALRALRRRPARSQPGARHGAGRSSTPARRITTAGRKCARTSISGRWTEIDREVLAAIADDVLGPTWSTRSIAAARQMFEATGATAIDAGTAATRARSRSNASRLDCAEAIAAWRGRCRCWWSGCGQPKADGAS